jgi:hypothetical protein
LLLNPFSSLEFQSQLQNGERPEKMGKQLVRAEGLALTKKKSGIDVKGPELRALLLLPARRLAAKVPRVSIADRNRSDVVLTGYLVRQDHPLYKLWISSAHKVALGFLFPYDLRLSQASNNRSSEISNLLACRLYFSMRNLEL